MLRMTCLLLALAATINVCLCDGDTHGHLGHGADGGHGRGGLGGHEPGRGELSGEIYLCEDETPYSLLNC